MSRIYAVGSCLFLQDKNSNFLTLFWCSLTFRMYEIVTVIFFKMYFYNHPRERRSEATDCNLIKKNKALEDLSRSSRVCVEEIGRHLIRPNKGPILQGLLSVSLHRSCVTHRVLPVCFVHGSSISNLLSPDCNLILP